MSFLLQARFNSSGPTNSDIINMGGVSFDFDSRIHNGEKCAFFEPCNDLAQLSIENNTLQTLTDYIGEEANDYTIYFKFCIDLRHRSETTPIPILSYINNTLGTSFYWINIEENKYFVFYMDDKKFGISKECDWVFDDIWHTCVITKTYGMFNLFLDGVLISSTTLEGTIPIKNSPGVYIGKSAKGTNVNSSNHFYNLYGMIDDFCIVDTIVYADTFIPPNVYWSGADDRNNFFQNIVAPTSYMPRDIMDETEQNMLRTAFHINETQKQWLPRRLRIQWHEEEYFFNCENFYRVSESRQYTAISLFGLEQPWLMEPHNDRFVQIFNARNWVENHKLYPFMLFIDHQYVKLSDIWIMKSDQYYTVFIDNRLPNKYKPIKSIELVIIPFFCIYKEDESLYPYIKGKPIQQDKDLPLLYAFNEYGYFDPKNPYACYWLDKEHSPEIDVSPIMEEYVGDDEIENADDPNGTIPDWMILQSQWRYGYFTESGASGTISNKYYKTFKFISSDTNYTAKVGDDILLYKNGVALEKMDYDIIGVDTFRFYLYPDNKATFDGLWRTKSAVSMQKIVHDDSTPYFYQGTGDIKEVTVVVEEEETTKVRIPEVFDNNGNKYERILVFRNSICLTTKDRVRFSFDKKWIIFTHPKDILTKGDPVTFIFAHSTKGDHQRGIMHVKPLYFHDEILQDGIPSFINLPTYKNITWNKNNIFVFINGKFLHPNRYNINNGRLEFPTAGMITSSSTVDDWIELEGAKEVTFVALRLANEYQDGTNFGNELIAEQYAQGSRFILYDTNIDKNFKLTLDNFVVFDQIGRYMPEITGEILNRNIIKYIRSTRHNVLHQPRYISCVYSLKRSLPNHANTVLPQYDDFFKAYIMMLTEFYELDLDFDIFMRDFDLRYSRDLHYATNLSHAFYYTIQQNQLNYLKVYKDRATCQRLQFSAKRMNDLYDHNGKMGDICIERGLYKDPAHRSFSIFFEDGKIPKWYETIRYSANQLYVKMPNKLDANSDLECFRFHNMQNELHELENTIT